MPHHHVVLIHGYSDRGEGFAAWKQALVARGHTDVTEISVCSYETLTNELTIKDIAEGLDRALRIKAGLDRGEPFDAIVHSTGMLVIRSWLAAYSTADPRLSRLKHLVALAPATWGSPLAHKGRSWVGAIFKGRKEFGPDFMEAGDLVLDGLELGSRFTWDLAHRDMFGTETFYGPTGGTPYVFIFCGNRGYTGLKSLIGEPGSDGTVRWAGCSMDCRKLELDLTGTPRNQTDAKIRPSNWSQTDAPVTFVDDTDHGGIIRDPPAALVDRVVAALQVSGRESYLAWQKETAAWAKPARAELDEWQQFVVRVVDERGDPVTDYNLQLLAGETAKLRPFDADVHAYGRDPSLRCFHVNLSKLSKEQRTGDLEVQLMAASGTERVGYYGVGTDKVRLEEGARVYDKSGKWDARFTLPSVVGKDIRFFYPFTTTLVEIRINREPLPLVGPNQVLKWI